MKSMASSKSSLSAPLLPVAREAILAALEIDANPSSVHASGRAAKAIIAKARRQVAGLVGAKADCSVSAK